MNKYMQSDIKLIIGAGGPSIFFSVFCAIFFRQGLVLASPICFLFALFSFMLCAVPKSWQRLHTDKPLHPLWRSFCVVISSQIILVIVFLAMISGLYQIMPVVTSAAITSMQPSEFVTWGMFPWGLFALMTFFFALGFDKPLSMGSLLKIVFPKIEDKIKVLKPPKKSKLMRAKIMMDVAARFSATFSVGFCLMIFSYALVDFVLVYAHGKLVLGFSMLNMVVFFFLSMAGNILLQKRKYQALFKAKQSMLRWLSLVVGFTFVVTLVAYGIVNSAALHDHEILPMIKPQAFFALSTATFALLFMLWAWWIGLTRIVAGLMAPFFVGHRGVFVILAYWILPLTCLGLYYVYQPASMMTYLGTALSSSRVALILILFSLIVLFAVFSLSSVKQLILCGESDNTHRRDYPRRLAVYNFIKFILLIGALLIGGVVLPFILASFTCATLVFFAILSVLLFASFVARGKAAG